MLSRADLPSTYKATVYRSDPTDAASQAALVRCVGGKNTNADKVAEVHSDDFALNNSQISSDANTFRSQADLDADVAIIKSPKVSGCYASLLRTELAGSLPSSAKIDSVELKITPGHAGLPSNVVGTGAGRFVITVQAQQVALYVDVAFITGHLIEAEIDFTDVGAPVPQAMQTALINKIAARAAAA